MFKKLKQLFCDHKYILYMHKDYSYVTENNTHFDKAKHYYMICEKCGKTIEILKSNKIEKIEKEYNKYN